MSIWVKICANTTLEDALVAVEAGADALGFIFAPSPRRVTAEAVAAIAPQLPAGVEKIGVFVDAPLEEIVSAVQSCGLTGVQLHFEAGPELPALLHARLGPELRVVRVLRFRPQGESHGAAQLQARLATYAGDPHVDALHVDTYAEAEAGGTGLTFDWSAAREAIFANPAAPARRIAAGGLNPENVAEAIAALRPWGVDVASGVEAAPGRKDARKVRELIARARAAAEDLA